MKKLGFICLLGLLGCQSRPRPPQPVADIDALHPSRATAMAIVVPPRDSWMMTNIFAVDNYDPRTVKFRVYHGTNDLAFFFTGDVPAAPKFSFAHRHWRGMRDWFRITSIDALGRESEYSDRTFWPQLPPDRMTIVATPPTTLQQSSDLKAWSSMGLSPQTVLFNQPRRYYRGVGRVKLETTLSNPLNE